MSAVDKAYLQGRPRGTVIQVTTPTGQRFQLVAEGGAFRDFILHSGTAPRGLDGRRAKYGGRGLFWSADTLARWVADGLCTIELAPPAGGSK